MKKIAIVIEGGMLQSVYGSEDLKDADIELIDLDLDTQPQETVVETLERLQSAKAMLRKLY